MGAVSAIGKPARQQLTASTPKAVYEPNNVNACTRKVRDERCFVKGKEKSIAEIAVIARHRRHRDTSRRLRGRDHRQDSRPHGRRLYVMLIPMSRDDGDDARSRRLCGLQFQGCHREPRQIYLDLRATDLHRMRLRDNAIRLVEAVARVQILIMQDLSSPGFRAAAHKCALHLEVGITARVYETEHQLAAAL